MSLFGSWQGWSLLYYYNEITTIFAREIYDQEIENEIRDAFIIFDKEGHGFISSAGYKTQNSKPHVSKIPEKTKISLMSCKVLERDWHLKRQK